MAYISVNIIQLKRVILYAFLALPIHVFCFNALASEYSSTLMGPIGLNVVPSARLMDQGHVHIGGSTLDPYLHGYLGFQLTNSVYLSLRQSAEISNINEQADRLYPGLDFKIRLAKERRYTPEIAVGLQSAIGHKRMAGEYIAASKRYRDFDFTAGLGWGRFGTAGHFSNPLKTLHKHFGKGRQLDGEMPNEPVNWFTGDDVGLFAGVEYFTPLKGLSFKADYGADRYSAEQRSFNFDAPAPWSIGLSYAPKPWVSAAIAMQGADKLMGRLTWQPDIRGWPLKPSKKDKKTPLHPFRSDTVSVAKMELAARADGAYIFETNSESPVRVDTQLALEDTRSAPRQYGTASVAMANHGGQEVERITLQPRFLSLYGPKVHLSRKDLERARAYHQGSASEMWRSTSFGHSGEGEKGAPRSGRFYRNQYMPRNFRLRLDNQISLAEEDSGFLYRTSLLAGVDGPSFMGLIHSGTVWRLNLHDNLDRLTDIRPRSLLPVRSDVDLFAQRAIALDQAHSTLTHSFNEETHFLASIGYLEEMYGALGGEILYRPFGKRYAFGAESWLALKRDPLVSLNAGFTGDSLLTGHINGWYDFPQQDVTTQLRFGRFLAEDIGGSFTVQKNFENGARIEGFVTLTDNADFDLFGGTTHLYNGVRLSLPLGSASYIPEGSDIRLTAAPLGRDIGQSIEPPIRLYEATDKFSYDHLARYWHEIVD